MNLLPMLVIGLVLGILSFATRRRSFLHTSKAQPTINNKEQLHRSLDALIAFLNKHDEPRWATHLENVKAELQFATERAALTRLSDMFGGMGSLNDVTFGTQELDDEADRLRGAVFRDRKLYFGNAADRTEWIKLEEQHKGELAPRIKHAFRKG
jgi:hypothetical protein